MEISSKVELWARRHWMLLVVLGLLAGAATASTEPAATSPDESIVGHKSATVLAPAARRSSATTKPDRPRLSARQGADDCGTNNCFAGRPGESAKSILSSAVRGWCKAAQKGSRERAEFEDSVGPTGKKYGPIGFWNVSAVTNMQNLFAAMGECNPPIGSWKMDQVTNVNNMFNQEQKFDQPLCWDKAWLNQLADRDPFEANLNLDATGTSFPVILGTGAIKAGVCVLTQFATKPELELAANMWCVNPAQAERTFSAGFVRLTSITGEVFELLGEEVLPERRAGCTGSPQQSYPVEGVQEGDCVRFGVGTNSKMHTIESRVRAASIGQWDVSLITDMSELFKGKSRCNPPVGNWNVGQVTTMRRMFDGAEKFDQPIGTWDVSKVTNFSSMLSGATAFNQPICWNMTADDEKNWGLSSTGYCSRTESHVVEGVSCAVTNFPSNAGTAAISNDGVCRVGRFKVKDFLKKAVDTWCRGSDEDRKKYVHISEWDVSLITDMSELFQQEQGQTACNPGWEMQIGAWNVSQVTNMRRMFNKASTFNEPIGTWNVSSVTSMKAMLSGASAFNKPIGHWDVAQVTDLKEMFSGATAFDQPICWEVTDQEEASMELSNTGTSFDTNLGTANIMDGVCKFSKFQRRKQLETAVNMWCGDETKAEAMAKYVGIGQWDVSLITDMSKLFWGKSRCNPPVGDWKVGKVTTMRRMFDGAEKFNQPIGSWDVSQVTDMFHMFSFASDFDQPIGTWDVSQVTDMSRMFEGAAKFNQRIGSWDVDQVTDMTKMFDGADAYKYAFCWDITIPDSSLIKDWRLEDGGWNLGRSSLKIDGQCRAGPACPKHCEFTKVSSKQNLIGKLKDWCKDSTQTENALGSIKWWIVEEVRDFSFLFEDFKDCNPPIGTWDVSQVTDFDSMFKGFDGFKQPLCWDLKASNSKDLFDPNPTVEPNQRTVLSLSNWQLNSTGTAFGYNLGREAILRGECDFRNFRFKGELEIAVNMWCGNGSTAAAEASFGGGIGQWDVSRITNMSELFSGKSRCNPPIVNWTVGQVTTMRRMFDGAEKFNQPIRTWTVSKVTDMSQMFKFASDFDQSIRTWDVSQVTDMSRMFKYARSFNADVRGWNVDKVTSMEEMFTDASSFDRILCWNVTGKNTEWRLGGIVSTWGRQGWLDGSLATHGELNANGVCEKTLWQKYWLQILLGMAVAAVLVFVLVAIQFNGQSTASEASEAVSKPPVAAPTEAVSKPPVAAPPSKSDFATNPAWAVQTSSWGNKLTEWAKYAQDFERAEELATDMAREQMEPVTIWRIEGASQTKWQQVAPPNRLWVSIKNALARVTGLDDQKLSKALDRRSSSSGSSVVQIHTASPTEAYTVIQALSTTSSGTLTQMVVQQLQATNYTGPMPTMITAVVQQVSQEGGASSSSGSASMTLVIAVSVAGGLLLVAALVVGALAYLWRSSKSAPGTTGQEATLPVVSMGAVVDVGIETNPMHH